MDSFTSFAFLWALSGLLDLVAADAWRHSPFHLCLAASSVFTLLRPGSRAGFAVLNAARLAVFAHDTPHTANHQVLFAIAAATILGAWPLAARRAGGARRVSRMRWLEAFAPALRVEALLLYAFAVLHKLNRDYFDPEVSCAVYIVERVAPGFVFELARTSDAFALALVAGSLLAEASVPVLLATPRTRRLGLAAGVLFHGVLGVRFYAFSSGLFGLFALFLAPAVIERAEAARRARRLRAGAAERLVLSPWTPRMLALGLAAGFAALWTASHQAPAWRPLWTPAVLGLRGVWAAAALAATAGLLAAAPARLCRGPAPGRLARATWLLPFPLLVAVNGLSPYLGLRTVPAFSMFSNLRTEGGTTNHWFMPASALAVASYQEDLVVILDSEDEELRRVARAARRRTFHDFRMRIQRMAERGKRGIDVTYRRRGEVVHLDRAERDPEIMEELSWLERKWLRFRPVPITPRRRCEW